MRKCDAAEWPLLAWPGQTRERKGSCLCCRCLSSGLCLPDERSPDRLIDQGTKLCKRS